METTRAEPWRLATCVVALYSLLLIIAAPSSATIQPAPHGDGSLLIGSFNIQVFGVTKVSKIDVLDVLIKILSRYDLVLIQEIRDISQTAIKILLDVLNEEVEDKYEMVLSDRLGRTSSKEQYTFFYKPSKLTLLWSYVYNDDTLDAFEREPFIAYFESPTTAVDRFGVIGVHVKPSDAEREINRLVEVYDDFAARSGQKNVILMGDFNADCNYVSNTALARTALRMDARFQWILPDDEDTTLATSDCAYDRFVIAGDELYDNTVRGKSRAYHFDDAYGLSQESAEDVSDHYPIEMVIQGNIEPTIPMSTTDSGTISCSGSFRAVVWMCLLVVAQEEDMPQCIHRVVKSINTYVERCTDEWIRLFMSYPKI